MFDKLKKTFAPAKPAPALPDGMSFFVAGVEYHRDDLAFLATEQKKFTMPIDKIIEKGWTNKKLFRYYFTNEPVQLVAEPNNAHDPNAVKVLINNIFVGYIPKDSNELALKMLAAGYQNITAKISGGDYKKVNDSGQVATFSDPIEIKIQIKR